MSVDKDAAGTNRLSQICHTLCDPLNDQAIPPTPTNYNRAASSAAMECCADSNSGDAFIHTTYMYVYERRKCTVVNQLLRWYVQIRNAYLLEAKMGGGMVMCTNTA